MDKQKLLLAILLATLVLFGLPKLKERFFPAPPQPQQQIQSVTPHEEATPTPTPLPQATPPKQVKVTSQPAGTVTQAAPREITIETRFWKIVLSNRGGVATSWILEKFKKADGSAAPIYAANHGPLELVSQEVIDKIGAPLRLHLPWVPSISDTLNSSYFDVQGVKADESIVTIDAGEERQITFSYASPEVTAHKVFTFRGDDLIFDATADVKVNGAEQPVEIVLGPRFGDQSDTQSGSYSTPPQVIAFNSRAETKRFVAAKITPPLLKINIAGRENGERYFIATNEKLLPGIEKIQILDSEAKNLRGYARIINRRDDQYFYVDSLPEGTSSGDRITLTENTYWEPCRWVALVDHYFAMIAVPGQPAGYVMMSDIPLKPDSDKESRQYPSASVLVAPGAVTRIFVGPKDRELLAQIGSSLKVSLDSILDYGMFASVIRPIIPLIGSSLSGVSAIFKNYGWGIVFVTVIINLVLSPMRWWSSRKMKKAAKHQPRLKEIQEKMKKLKENPKKNEKAIEQLQREQMGIMKEANPLGGCLPMLLQMPIFWAFFIYLTISLDVRQEPWIFWIKDLSIADPWKLLPIVMCVSMIGSSYLQPMPQSNDPSQKMQKMMMTWLMPIMLTWFFFLRAPSGLVLYWMVSNIVGVFIQLAINKMSAEPVEQAVASSKQQKSKDSSKKGK